MILACCCVHLTEKPNTVRKDIRKPELSLVATFALHWLYLHDLWPAQLQSYEPIGSKKISVLQFGVSEQVDKRTANGYKSFTCILACSTFYPFIVTFIIFKQTENK